MIVRPKGGVLIFMCHDGACCSMGLYPQQKMGDNVKFDTSTEKGKRVFEDYYSTREAIRPVIHGVMMGCWRGPNRQKSDTVLELETLYEALRHQEWLDTEERFESDIRSREPMQWGNEPIPKIERVG